MSETAHGDGQAGGEQTGGETTGGETTSVTFDTDHGGQPAVRVEDPGGVDVSDLVEPAPDDDWDGDGEVNVRLVDLDGDPNLDVDQDGRPD